MSEWQPISTAPKDGTLFIALTLRHGVLPLRWQAYGEGSQAHEEYKKGEGPIGGFWWSDPIHNWTQTIKFTGWMSLPQEAPK